MTMDLLDLHSQISVLQSCWIFLCTCWLPSIHVRFTRHKGYLSCLEHPNSLMLCKAKQALVHMSHHLSINKHRF